MRVVYGITASTANDEFLALEEKAQFISNQAYTPGKYFVEVLPILQYVPAWFPGAQFKRDAAKWYVSMQETRNKPFDVAVESIVRFHEPDQ